MHSKLAVIMSSGLVLAFAGCKSTSTQSTETQPAANTPVATQAVAAQISSRRVYDASYVPPSLHSKVDSKGDGYINKPFVVKELLIDGKVFYEVTNEGASSYYDIHGTELAGADRERISSQVKAAAATR